MTEPNEQQPAQPPPPAPTAPPPPSTYGAPPPGAPPIPPGYGYAPPVPPGMYYDPVSGVVLPDGVVLASVGRRIGAYFLGILLMIVTLVIGYLIWGLVVWGRGTTPALQVLGMKVWHQPTNQVPGWGKMAFREVVGRFLIESVVNVVGIVSFVFFLTNRDHKPFHDMIGNTIVVHDPNGVLAS